MLKWLCFILGHKYDSIKPFSGHQPCCIRCQHKMTNKDFLKRLFN